MLHRRSVSLPLFAVLSICGLHAQFADTYREASQAYRNAAAQEGFHKKLHAVQCQLLRLLSQ
jgi:hypothetical protein